MRAPFFICHWIGAAPQSRQTRRGAVYIMVLGMGFLLATVGVAVLVGAQLEGRRVRRGMDAQEAEVLAGAAVECTTEILNSNVTWRTTLTNNTASTATALGHGAITAKLIDETDGDLSNSATDAVRVYATARVGQATKIASVQLLSTHPVSALAVAAQANGVAKLNSTTLNSTKTISSNAKITANSCTIPNAILESSVQVQVTGGTFNGTKATLLTARTQPNPAHVFDFYQTNGTSIAITAIPTNGSSISITNVLFSPASNPYQLIGGTNASGIYVIDCLNHPVQIQNVRVVGTLVLLNVGSGSLIKDSQYWTPAVSNYPTLLVQGDMTFQMNGSSLADSSPTINYNPPGTPYPYPSGSSDTTYSTSYPCEIDGLVYVTGNVTTSSNCSFKGCLIAGGTLTTSNNLTLGYDSTFYTRPPPGFIDTSILTPVPGTWRWEQSP